MLINNFKWSEINVEAYKIIYTEGKERLKDAINDSENITNKAIKLLSALLSLFGIAVGFIIQQKINVGFNIIFLVPMLLSILILIWILFPKQAKEYGIQPNILIPKNFDSKEDKEYQSELLYYSAIRIIQERIDFMIKQNEYRTKCFNVILFSFILSLAGGCTILFLTIGSM